MEGGWQLVSVRVSSLCDVRYGVLGEVMSVSRGRHDDASVEEAVRGIVERGAGKSSLCQRRKPEGGDGGYAKWPL